MSRQVYEKGTLIRTYDDSTRTVTDLTTTPPTTRPYTAEENATADAETAQRAAEANESTLRANARASITEIKTALATLDALISKSNSQWQTADTKQVVRLLRDTLRISKDTIRLVIQAVETTD